MPIPDNLPAQNPYGSIVSFSSQNVQPPSAIYLSPSDALVLQLFAATADSTVTMQYRILRPDGELVSSTVTVSTNFAGSFKTVKVIPPTEGFLLSLVLLSSGFLRGQCYAQVFLSPDGAQANIPTLAHLVVQGYVSVYNALTFPQSVPENELAGRGWLRDVVMIPTLGGPTVLTVPNQVRWLIRACTFIFNCDGTAGNRQLTVNVIDPTGFITAFTNLPTILTAGQTAQCTVAPGLPISAMPQSQTSGFPNDLLVAAGWKVQITSGFFGALDEAFNGRLTVEEFQAS